LYCGIQAIFSKVAEYGSVMLAEPETDLKPVYDVRKLGRLGTR
jgi:hypothetical protein